ncbi:MAG: transporter, family, galactose:H+ symporter, partial [Pseudomonadota bacterium]|nr:transporter, family, galactose:H+ symporter [Pseudomonadota bacterium]
MSAVYINTKNAGNNDKHNSMQTKRIVIWICLTAALGGLLFGLDQGFIANSLESIKNVYHLGDNQAERYAAILATGGVVGALLSGFFARFLGRKKSLVLAGALFSGLSLISATLPVIYILTICRFGLGFAVGVASFIVPLYLSETAPTYIRGSMGALFQLMITIGIFLIAVANVIIAKIFIDPQVALPIMFLVIVVFALLMLFGSLRLPESPRWLMLKGKKEKAVKVLHKILNTQEEIDNEILEIQEAIESDRGVSFGGVFKGYFLKILIMGIILQMFQQLVGINMMIYYAPTIFGYAGMTGIIALLTVPTVNMLFTFPAIRLVEKWGRKKLLYVGSTIMMIAMFTAGMIFYLMGNITDPSQINMMPKVILLISAIIYIFGFAISWGPVAWIICSEVFPLECREFGMTITTMVNWTFAGIVMGNALNFMHTYGNFSIFIVFDGFCLVSMVFLKFFVQRS